MPRLALSTAALLLSGCIVPNPFNPIDDLTSTSGGSATETFGDGDGDPATSNPGDGDGDPSTTTSGPGDGDGDPSTTTGDGDGEPACARVRWEYSFTDTTWINISLDAIWIGANAPPCEVEIWGATYIEALDQLLVFAADGNFYRQAGDSWAPPRAISAAFPQLGINEIDSVIYVPSIDDAAPQILINSLPRAYVYSMSVEGEGTHFETVMIADEVPPGPAQSQHVRTWALSYGDPDLFGQAEWWTTWQRFEDGQVYRADGAFNWLSWPEDTSPPFLGDAAPNASTLEAAWGDHEFERGYFIGF